MFIDADVGISDDQVLRLLSDGYGVTGGIYPLKSVFWKRVVTGDLPPDVWEARSLGYAVGVGGTRLP